MQTMDVVLSTVLTQIYPTLLIDHQGVIRFVSAQLPTAFLNKQLTDALPQLPMPPQELQQSSNWLRGPLLLPSAGPCYYRQIAVQHGGFNGVCLVFQPTDAGQELQQQLQHLQKLLYHSEKMAVLGQLTTSITHEINNPIAYVYSNMQTLTDYSTDLIKMIEALAEVTNSGEVQAIQAEFDFDYLKSDLQSLLQESGFGLSQVLAQIAALKDLSHSDELHFQLADIQTGIQSCILIVQNNLKYKTRLQQELTPLPQIECIPSQIFQVVLNLLINAGHAISDNGLIVVRSGSDASQIWIEVEDNGAGIAPEHLEKIFEPFFTTKEVGKGTGLGLALCQNIITRHHGRIEVNSAPGCGSSFKIWLPRQQP